MKKKGNANSIMLKGHEAYIKQLELCQDLRRIVTASNDSTIRVWDIDNGNCLHVLKGHIGKVESITFHPDGRRLVSSGEDKTFRIWDMESGKCLGLIEFPKDKVRNNFIIHPDGKILISYLSSRGWDPSSIKLWDIDTLECTKVLMGHTESILEVFLHPDGKRLISWVEFGDEDSVRVWDLQSGECLQSLHKYIICVENVKLSPDGRQLIVWSRSPDFDEDYENALDAPALVWDFDTQKAVMLEGHKNFIIWLDLHPDGQRFISRGADNTVRIWDGKTGICSNTFIHNHVNYKFHPNGQWVITFGDREVRIWDKKGNCLHTLIHDKDIRFVEPHPDGKRLLTSSEKDIYIWDIDKELCEHVLTGHTDTLFWQILKFHFIGKLLISYGRKEIRIWDIHKGTCLHILEAQPSRISYLRLHPDCRHILSKGNDLRIWDIETGNCLDILEAHTAFINGTLLHPDGKRVISWSNDGAICIWRIDSVL